MVMKEDEEEFMLNLIRDICEKIGPRLAFTKQEEAGAIYTAEKFKNYSKNTSIEKFTARIEPFLIEFRVSVICYIISAIFYSFSPWISLIIMCFSIATLLLVNVWNIRFFRIFGKVGQSQNVISKIPPKKESKKIVIFGSHIDSAYELSLIRKFQQKFMGIVAIGLFFMVLTLIFSMFKLILGTFQFFIYSFDILSIILLCGIAGVFPFYFMVNYNNVVEGANDNLSATAVCLNLCRKFSQNPPNHVELWFLTFGAEEGGRIGSSQYAKRHEDELKDSYTINFETLGGKGRLVIIKKEITVPHSMEIIKLLSQATENIGYSMELYSIPIAGGTDSWSFSKRGLKAAAITNLSEKTIPEGWHCREDTPDIIDPKKLKIVSDVSIEFIKILDEKLS